MTQLMSESRSALEMPGSSRVRGRTLLWVCAAVLGLLCFWVWLFPYTCDGDSVLHFMSALDTAANVANGLYAWCRPGYKIPLSLFAVHGVFAARMFNAFITLACLWQTVRLAEDLKLRWPLAAGVMFLFQPLVFALAADTMTEIPMALGAVIAVRLWLNGWFGLSGMVVGFLPMVRPEGFFLGVLWGAMVLFCREIGWKKKPVVLLCLALGLLAWAGASKALTGDWLLVVHVWSWPPGSYTYYGHGPIWHYAARWPEYCGIPLFVLFTWGMISIGRGKWRGMRLVVGVWALVFAVHAVLFWGAWFASCGLLRILACTSPMIAVICLRGWNEMVASQWGQRMALRHAWLAGRKGILLGCGVIAAWGMGQYFIYGEHFDCMPIMKTAAYIRQEHLLGPTTHFVGGNKVVTAELGLSQQSPMVVELPVDAEKSWAGIRGLPIGSIVVWDNRQAAAWFSTDIDQMRKAGFTVLHEEQFNWCCPWFLGGGEFKYFVMRKDAPTPATRPVL